MEGRMSTTSNNGSLLTAMSGRHDDMEAGSAKTDHSDHEELEHDPNDPFDIDNTKNAFAASLRRWRQAALMLNASRWFRYTLDLNKEEHYENQRRMIRAHAQVIRAALLFKLAGEQQIGAFGSSSSIPATSTRNVKKEVFRNYLESNGVLDTLTKVMVALYEQNDKPSSALEFIQKKIEGSSVSDYEKLQVEKYDL